MQSVAGSLPQEKQSPQVGLLPEHINPSKGRDVLSAWSLQLSCASPCKVPAEIPGSGRVQLPLLGSVGLLKADFRLQPWI